MGEVSIIGLDLAKNVFQACVSACNFDGVDGPCPYRGADCRHVA